MYSLALIAFNTFVGFSTRLTFGFEIDFNVLFENLVSCRQFFAQHILNQS